MMEVAVVTTVWSKNSHADVIAGKFLRGFPTDEGVMRVIPAPPTPHPTHPTRSPDGLHAEPRR